jgi:hypothetical protein
LFSFEVLLPDGFICRGAVDILKFGTWANVMGPDARETTGLYTHLSKISSTENRKNKPLK